MAPWTASDLALQIAYQPATSKQKYVTIYYTKTAKAILSSWLSRIHVAC